MIDLHSHILPNLDDGPRSIHVSVEMARVAAADGITHMACTPHIVPGVYDNDRSGIERQVEKFARVLDMEGIELALSVGADVHFAPRLEQRLMRSVPTINRSRYFLFEPPSRQLPPRLVDAAKATIDAGFVPVLTHPERLLWAHRSFDTIRELGRIGCLLQLTAGSITGAFGRDAARLSDRMLREGMTDLVASDAHNLASRAPVMSTARDHVEAMMGKRAAHALFTERPERMWNDAPIEPSVRTQDADASVGQGPPPPTSRVPWSQRFRKRIIG